jgi:hypothetical protein
MNHVVKIWKLKGKQATTDTKERILFALEGREYKKNNHYSRWKGTKNSKALTNVSAIHTFLGSKKERRRNPDALDDFLNTSYFGFDWSRYAKKRAQTTTAKNLERPAKKTKVSPKVEQMLQLKIQQLEGMTNVVAEQGADLFGHKQDLREAERKVRQLEHEKVQDQAQHAELQRVYADKDEEARGVKRALSESERTVGKQQQQIAQHATAIQVVEQREGRRIDRLVNGQELLRGQMASHKQGKLVAEAASRENKRESREKGKEIGRKDKELAAQQRTIDLFSSQQGARIGIVQALSAQHQAEKRAERSERERDELRCRVVEAEQQAESDRAARVWLQKRAVGLAEQVQACTGKRSGKGRYRKDLQEVVDLCRAHWTERDPDAVADGYVEELEEERDSLEEMVADLEEQLVQAKAKEKLLAELQVKVATVPIMTLVGKSYTNKYKLLLMSLVGNSSSVYQVH